MTAISPLQSIHKKGLFGDHHKKNKANLLTISEIKDLNIIQIFQYKNSKIQSAEFQVDSLNLSLQNLQVLSNKDTRILWSAPNTSLVISKKEDIMTNVMEECNSENFAVTDISHSRAAIQIQGFNANEVLKKGCPINFNEFKKNNCVGSILHGINIVIDYVNDDPQTYNIITLRSFGESLYHHVTDASLEFGYIGA